MEKLKILFITKNHAQQVEKSSHYFANELAKHTRLHLWHEHGNLQNILAHIPFKPDFILLNDFKPDYCPLIRGLRNFNIPIGTIMHDLQYKKGRRKYYIEKENIKHIFTIYRDPFLKYYPEFKDRMIWLPHHVPTHIFKDYQLPKKVNWLMMGSTLPNLYPFRLKMLHTMRREPGFVYHPHPGYRDVKRRDKSVLVGESYAKEINRAKMFLTCNSNYKFSVLKYFEALACRTLLLAPESKELKDLGFIDGKTFVAVNKENFKDRAFYYLHHENERMAIAKRGFEMVREKHTTVKRVEQFLSEVKTIIKSKKV